jgi:hypothetical protein
MYKKAGFSSDIANTIIKDYSFRAPFGSSGTFYIAGYYDASASSVTLTNASTTQVYGGTNHAHGAHAFMVASAAGTTDGSDLVLTVSGTSITDEGVRTTSDSEVIVVDCTLVTTNQYLETVKKWIGQITYTLSSTAGTTFSFTFNYGLCKYEDAGNRDFRLTDFEIVGRAGANDSGFNVGVIHHKFDGWTYHASAFVPGAGFAYDMNTDYNTEINLASGESFAWKRAGIAFDVNGAGSEGVLLSIITTSNNAVESMNLHLVATL